MDFFTYKNIVTAGTYTIRAAVLARININASAAGGFVVYDGQSAAGTVVATVASTASTAQVYNAAMNSGYITIVVGAGAVDITVMTQ